MDTLLPDELPELTLRLHVKILVDPSPVTLESMIEAMRSVYAQARIRLEISGIERLSRPGLESVDVDGCAHGVVTDDQEALFSHRNGVGPGDVVVYFVRSTVPPTNGCAAHPAGRPGAVVVRGATRWTLAHEVAHVLGLEHVGDARRLMYRSTAKIEVSPPELAAEEIAAMRASPLLRPPSP